MKAVCNTCYGSFALNEQARSLLAERAPELFERGRIWSCCVWGGSARDSAA